MINRRVWIIIKRRPSHCSTRHSIWFNVYYVIRVKLLLPSRTHVVKLICQYISLFHTAHPLPTSAHTARNSTVRVKFGKTFVQSVVVFPKMNFQCFVGALLYLTYIWPVCARRQVLPGWTKSVILLWNKI